MEGGNDVAKRKENVEKLSISILRKIIKEELEVALGEDGEKAQISNSNARLIYDTVMNGILKMLKSLKPGQEIKIADWLSVKRTIYDARPNMFLGKTTWTGELMDNPLWCAQSKLKFIGRNEAERSMRQVHSNDEARIYLKKQYGEDYVPKFDRIAEKVEDK